MEISSAALTGLFFGMAWALIKVVGFFVKKYGKNTDKMTLVDEQARKLDEICKSCELCIKHLDNIEKTITHLDDLHSVYDENHVPKWYVPKEILSTVKSIQSDIDTISIDLKSEFGKIYAGQSISVEKISELINSQKLVTERLGDLIALWAKGTKIM